MGDYITEGVSLTDGQYKKLRAAHGKGEGATIQLSSTQLRGNNKISLTRNQVKNLQKARLKRKGIRLKLSKIQLINVRNQYGGFIPLGLAGALAVAAPVIKTLATAGAFKLGADGVAEGVKWLAKKVTGRGARKAKKIMRNVESKKISGDAISLHGTQFYRN